MQHVIGSGIAMMYNQTEQLEKRSKRIEVVVVIPTLDEEAGIGTIIDQIQSALRGREFAILVVDGHSSDKTREIAKEKGATVIFQRERGYGDGLLSGFDYAASTFSPQIIAMMDGDGTYNPSDIPKIIDPILENEADLVSGDRLNNLQPDAMSFTNRIGNRIISSLSRRFLGLRLRDTQCGLRAFRTELAFNFTGQSDGMAFATEMLVDAKQARARIKEVPINYSARLGRAKLSPFKDGSRILGIIIRLIRDCKPLLFFGAIGAIMSLAGLVLGSSVVVEWIRTGTVNRVPTAMLTVLFVLIGVQFFSLGLVADMIKGVRSRRLRF